MGSFFCSEQQKSIHNKKSINSFFYIFVLVQTRKYIQIVRRTIYFNEIFLFVFFLFSSQEKLSCNSVIVNYPKKYWLEQKTNKINYNPFNFKLDFENSTTTTKKQIDLFIIIHSEILCVYFSGLIMAEIIS